MGRQDVSPAKFYFIPKQKQYCQINREEYGCCDAEHEKRVKMHCGVQEQQDRCSRNQGKQDLL